MEAMEIASATKLVCQRWTAVMTTTPHVQVGYFFLSRKACAIFLHDQWQRITPVMYVFHDQLTYLFH